MSADILLTGAGGQLGFELARRASPAGLNVAALAHGDLDICDREAVGRAIETIKPKVVVNAAAYTAVDKAETEPAKAFAVNCDGAANLAQASGERDIPIIHFSTDYVFDGSKAGPYREEDRTAPLGVYGMSKEAGEAMIRALNPRHIILRTGWLYGPYGANFLKTMLRLGREHDTVRVVDDQYGSPTHAGDLAAATLTLASRLAAAKMREKGYGTFHCTAQGATTWHGFAARIFEIAGRDPAQRPALNAIATKDYPTQARRPANSVLDCSRLAEVHGLILRPWQQALAEAMTELAGHDPGQGEAPISKATATPAEERLST